MKSSYLLLNFLLFFWYVQQTAAQHLVYYNNFEKLVEDDNNSGAIKPANTFALSGSPDLIQNKYNKIHTSPFGNFKGPYGKYIIKNKPIKPIGDVAVGFYVRTYSGGTPESFYVRASKFLKPSTFKIKFKYSVYDLNSSVLVNSLYILLGSVKENGFLVKDSILINGPFISHEWKEIETTFSTLEPINSIAFVRNTDNQKDINDTCTDYLKYHYTRTVIESYMLIDNIELYDLNGINPKIEKEKRKPAKHMVYFKTNSYQIEDRQRDSLLKFLNNNLKYNIEQVEMIGHADSVGTSDYNKKLANNRVKSVGELISPYKQKFSKGTSENIDITENKRCVELQLKFKD